MRVHSVTASTYVKEDIWTVNHHFSLTIKISISVKTGGYGFISLDRSAFHVLFSHAFQEFADRPNAIDLHLLP